MSYIRVIPRDLFNEANLLKCLGRLVIAIETAGDHAGGFAVEDVPFFDIEQDPRDGSIAVANLPFLIGASTCRLSRPLNSRAPWPLFVSTDDGDVVAVFDDKGGLTDEFMDLICCRKGTSMVKAGGQP